MTCSVPLVLALLAPAAPVAAPVVYFEQTTSSRVGNGEMGPGVLSRAYHAGKRMRLEAGGGDGEAFLLRLDLKQAYRLDPERKVAQQLDVERLRAQTQMDMYLTGALPLGVDSFTDLLDWSGASEPMAALLGELRTLHGFPLETRTRVNVLGEVHETVSTITKVKVGDAPADIFDVPKGWIVEQEEAP